MREGFTHRGARFLPVVGMMSKQVKVEGSDRHEARLTERAAWATDRVPGLIVLCWDRLPEQRMDPTLGTRCSLTHAASGLSVVDGLSGFASLCDVLLYLGSLGIDWTQPPDAVMQAVAARTDLEAAMRSGDRARALVDLAAAARGLTAPVVLPTGRLRRDQVLAALGQWNGRSVTVAAHGVETGFDRSSRESAALVLPAMLQMARALPAAAKFAACVTSDGAYLLRWSWQEGGRSSRGTLKTKPLWVSSDVEAMPGRARIEKMMEDGAFFADSVDSPVAINYVDSTNQPDNKPSQAETESPMTTSAPALSILVALATTGSTEIVKAELGKSFSAHVVALKRGGLVEKVDEVWTLTRAAVAYAVEHKLDWSRAAAERVGALDLLPAPAPVPTAAPKKARSTAAASASTPSGERANPWPLEHEPPALELWAGDEVKTWNGYTVYPLPEGFGARTPEGTELVPAAKGATCFKRQQAARWAVWADHARVQQAVASSQVAAA